MAASRSSSSAQVGAAPMSCGVRSALGERPIEPRVDRLADEVQRAAGVLNDVGAARVDDDRAADLDGRVGEHRRVQPLDGVGPDPHVGVHQQHEPAATLR